MAIRRVCFYAGPDAGKSITGMEITVRLRMQKYRTEYINEFAKDFLYSGREFKTPSEQFLVFAKQKNKENDYLRNGCNFIITDSPLLFAWIYSKERGFMDDLDAIKMSEVAFEAKYPSLNIFLRRPRIAEEHEQEGRYHNFEQCSDLDGKIFDMIKGTGRAVYEFAFNDHDGIEAFIKAELAKEQA